MDKPLCGASCQYPPSNGETDCPITKQAQAQDVKILSLNVEGLTSSKKEVVNRLASDNNASIIFLQETHKSTTCIGIPNFETVFETTDPRHGLATLIRSDIITC